MKWEDYIVANPGEIETPALLVFEDKLDENIRLSDSLSDC